MKMAIIVPIFGGLHESKPFWGNLVAQSSFDSDLIIFDNGASLPEAQEPSYKSFFERYVIAPWKGEKAEYWGMPDNLGMIKTMQHVYEKTDYDIMCFIHNDLFLYDQNWDTLVRGVFEANDKAGLCGCFGGKGVFQNTVRFHVHSNLLEAEIHGFRMEKHTPPLNVAVLDGMMLTASRKMLDVRGGVDLSFDTHHFYDLDLSLESIDRGFDNYIVPLYAHHVSGLTACRPAFQDWANQRTGVDRAEYEVYYRGNQARFVEKWGSRLPYHVDKGWNAVIHG